MGRKTEKVVPFPGSLSTSIEPKWASMTPFTMERPGPEPATFRVCSVFTR